MSDREDEEGEMLAAAALWAKGGDGSDDNDDSPAPAADESYGKKKPKREKQQDNSWRKDTSTAPDISQKSTSAGGGDQWLTPESVVYSVHITQLPFEATVREVRAVFEKKGCIISSIRFVYGRDAKKGGERTFRGVAFCDFADRKSCDKALELDKTLFPGHSRRMNVRPTKTKEELAAIVEKREKMLEAKNFSADRSAKGGGDKNKRRHIEARKHNPEGKKKKKWSHKKGGDNKGKKGGNVTSPNKKRRIEGGKSGGANKGKKQAAKSS